MRRRNNSNRAKMLGQSTSNAPKVQDQRVTAQGLNNLAKTVMDHKVAVEAARIMPHLRRGKKTPTMLLTPPDGKSGGKKAKLAWDQACLCALLRAQQE